MQHRRLRLSSAQDLDVQSASLSPKGQDHRPIASSRFLQSVRPIVLSTITLSETRLDIQGPKQELERVFFRRDLQQLRALPNVAVSALSKDRVHLGYEYGREHGLSWSGFKHKSGVALISLVRIELRRGHDLNPYPT